MIEERLENIETKISFQEDQIEELNKTVYQQQQKLDRLQAICEALARQVRSLAEAGNEGTVGILNDRIGLLFSRTWIFPELRFVSFDRGIRSCPFTSISHCNAITNDKIWADDYTDVICFKSLTGMDTTHLTNRVRFEYP